MAYVSLYRKYRSQSFGEVVGQNHVTTVLQNAIRSGRIAHAYLFCGPRGCGKTSTARLLARALNCQSVPLPTPDPCGACDMCLRIRDGSAMDVIEMDAASETGIDDVREKIIENAKYAPGEARFKVYIIDEVHDLSAKAFDSLLKTIEEPPAHVVFILATTEAHKVPITVRSRCQRLDFRRGAMADLCANLRRVLDQEGIAHEQEAVAALARAAEGSFRDSLSLLEQVMAYSDGELTAEAVHAAIGAVGPELLDEVTRVLASDDMGEAFLCAGRLVDSGKDVRQILTSLQSHLRDLLVAGIVHGPQSLADVSPERFAQLKEQAGLFGHPQLLSMIDVLAEAERDVRFTNQHRLLLERAFWSIVPSSIAQSRSAPPVKTTAPAASDERAAPASAGRGSRPAAPESPRSAPAETRVPAHAEERALPDAPSVSETAAAAPTIDLDGLRKLWPRVHRRISGRSPAAAGFMQGVEVVGLDGRFVLLGFPDNFKRDRADEPKRKQIIEKAFADELGGAALKVRSVLLSAQPQTTASLAQAPPSLELSEEQPAPPAAANGIRSEGHAPDEGESKAAEPDILAVVTAEFQGKLLDE